MSKATGTLHVKSIKPFEWNVRELAKAMKITENDVKEYFTDGRRVSFLLERRVAYEVLNGKLAPSEGAGYDLLDSNGHRWEVRSVTHGGVYFSPSKQKGYGRRFEEKGFLAKLEDIEGYVLADIEVFPRIPFWIVSSKIVRSWYKSGQLGKNAEVSRAKALALLATVRQPTSEA